MFKHFQIYCLLTRVFGVQPQDILQGSESDATASKKGFFVWLSEREFRVSLLLSCSTLIYSPSYFRLLGFLFLQPRNFLFPRSLEAMKKIQNLPFIGQNHIPRIRIRSWAIVMVTYGFQGFRSKTPRLGVGGAVPSDRLWDIGLLVTYWQVKNWHEQST